MVIVIAQFTFHHNHLFKLLWIFHYLHSLQILGFCEMIMEFQKWRALVIILIAHLHVTYALISYTFLYSALCSNMLCLVYHCWFCCALFFFVMFFSFLLFSLLFRHVMFCSFSLSLSL